ncbi:hypothetical protein E8E13_004434 [Curvularia kusanoi]|uniref:Uncharacterized protein n=1 Tax=Curvularia kusanoi TaxID=90978 RepID=A0A9P4W5U5_CURKU|nr:hypothetical protein E8E13_004434 [Curvularia kusanoi]
MPPKNHKIVRPRRSTAPRKSQTPAQARKPQLSTGITSLIADSKLEGQDDSAQKPIEKKQLLLKLKLPKDKLLARTLPNVFPPTAPPSEHASDESPDESLPKVKAKAGAAKDGQSKRRGARQRTKTHQPDMVFGSEMDKLLSSSTAFAEVKGEEEQVNNESPPPPRPFASSPPSLPHNDSSSTLQDLNLPPPRCTPEVSQEASSILRALQSSLDIQIDLPDLTSSKESHGKKAYTAALLTELYIQSYENEAWHLCDLIADTWIRALQKANRRSYRNGNVKNRMWRENRALHVREGRSGFRDEPQEYRLDIQDPKLDRDVSAIDPNQLHNLFTHTRPGCGARLLWADAIALRGQKMEKEFCKRSEAWPEDLFYDVACTALRMVGKRLTLKIEDKYEGAWCRYHEHVKHRQPCYRKSAWLQQGAGKSEQEAEGESESEEDPMEGVEHGAKHVRFDVEDEAVYINEAESGTDTDSDSEEER